MAVSAPAVAPELGAGEAIAANGGALVPTLGVHAVDRMTQYGITQDMVTTAINSGQAFYDPVNGSVVYVLDGGMASGRSLSVATNALTGRVNSVWSSFSNPVRSRFVPLSPP